MQHISGRDLLVMSKVSKSWNNCIEAEINEKFTLNLPNDVRKYRDIELTRKYKHVSMKIANISKLEALSKVANSAEVLKIVVEEEKEEPLKFPNLKSLELVTISNINDFSWITKVQMDQLEELKIKNEYPSDDHDQRKCPFCSVYDCDFLRSQDDLIEFFMRLENLKSLDLYESEAFFLYTVKQNYGYRYLPVQLETLKSRFIEPFDDVIDLESLKSLKSQVAYYDKISNILSRHKDLTKLEIEFDPINEIHNSVNEYPENNSIKDLTLQYSKLAIDKAILKATPEVENLHVYELSPEFIRFVAETSMKMKTLKYVVIEHNTFEKYEEMKQSQLNINRNIHFIQENF